MVLLVMVLFVMVLFVVVVVVAICKYVRVGTLPHPSSSSSSTFISTVYSSLTSLTGRGTLAPLVSSTPPVPLLLLLLLLLPSSPPPPAVLLLDDDDDDEEDEEEEDDDDDVAIGPTPDTPPLPLLLLLLLPPPAIIPPPPVPAPLVAAVAVMGPVDMDDLLRYTNLFLIASSIANKESPWAPVNTWLLGGGV